jgi:DNA replication and repair protein RecF
MLLENLHLLYFKNYEEADIYFSPHINCFVGDNGSGKTNLLDAIHYLSLTKSAFTASDLQNIKQDESFFVVKGRFQQQGSPHTVQCTLRVGQKKVVTHNKAPYEKVSEHIGRFPVVLITPYDTDLIREGSEERRKFFDSLISQLDHPYLDLLIRYNHLLKQRNSLLKQFADRQYLDEEYLRVLDEQLVPAGQVIARTRQTFLDSFGPVFLRHYRHLSDSHEEVTLQYKSQLPGADFAQLLEQARRKDLALQRTTVGPHRDDFVFQMDGLPVKNYGSQGQQKSYVIALKLAQFEVLAQKKQAKPLLLLDDIFDRLDEKRITKLLEMVADHTFGQLFITDSHLDRTEKVLAGLSEEVKRFRVVNGTVGEL